MAIAKLNGGRRKKLRMSAGSGRNQKSPTADWVRAVATIAVKKVQAEMESKQK